MGASYPAHRFGRVPNRLWRWPMATPKRLRRAPTPRRRQLRPLSKTLHLVHLLQTRIHFQRTTISVFVEVTPIFGPAL